MSPKSMEAEIDMTVLRKAATAIIGIPNHPATVRLSVTEAPRTGQLFVTVLEITRGPVKVHVLKVNAEGELVRHRYNH